MRPGIGHEELTVVLSIADSERAEQIAAAAGLPTGVWAGLVIEAERALSRSATQDVAELADALDLEAARTDVELLAHRSRRLVGYGLALKGSPPRPVLPAQLSLRVVTSQQSIIAWELGAAAAGLGIERWAAETLSAFPRGRERWEAAAAIAGVSLGEWVAVQAARRARA